MLLRVSAASDAARIECGPTVQILAHLQNQKLTFETRGLNQGKLGGECNTHTAVFRALAWNFSYD